MPGMLRRLPEIMMMCRIKGFVLTIYLNLSYSSPVRSSLSGYGFGSSFRRDALAMRRTVYGFFYALCTTISILEIVQFVMVGVLGGCKACRNHVPVYQLDALTTRCLVAPVGDYLNHDVEVYHG